MAKKKEEPKKVTTKRAYQIADSLIVEATKKRGSANTIESRPLFNAVNKLTGAKTPSQRKASASKDEAKAMRLYAKADSASDAAGKNRPNSYYKRVIDGQKMDKAISDALKKKK